MIRDTDSRWRFPAFSRRDFFNTTGIGAAALSGLAIPFGPSALGASAQPASADLAASFPYRSLRDFMAVLEGYGMVRHFDQVDQDAFEGTAIMYRMVERYGKLQAPVLVFDKVKSGGAWRKGRVIANHMHHLDIEALLFGLEPVPNDPMASYWKARAHVQGLIDSTGKGVYPEIEPVMIERSKALCKEVVIKGDDIDITQYPFFKNNPAEPDRFINTAAVFTQDPEMGLNFGTYRCQVKGPRHISVGSGDGQTGYRMLMAAKERGEKTARISLVLGADPFVYLMSGSRLASRRGDKPVNELAVAGGLRGQALEIVKSDTNDLPIPAHAEMIIEGIIDLSEPDPNGPYAESGGYVGEVYQEAFKMDVVRITHRRDPWFVNDFTGIGKALCQAPANALQTTQLKALFPQITDYRYVDSVVYLSIKKTAAGQGLDIGKRLASFIPVFKIVMVVDDDVNLMDFDQIHHAFATRWQPWPATHIFDQLMETMPLEASAPQRGLSSKAVIDATRQWPEEGGPQAFPESSRALLVEAAPDIFTTVDRKWGGLLNGGS